MKEIVEKELNVENMIYEIDGKEVMLDSDLAALYQVETKRINEAVKNNPEKFPERFSYVLDDKSITFLRSKISTLEIKGQGKYSKYAPRVFTEQGIYMLATVLKSGVATKVSIRIMDTFVHMRHYINFNRDFLPHKFMLLEEKVDINTKRIDELFDRFNPKDIAKNAMFLEGHFYDAYSLLLAIFDTAKEGIIIIDNYASKELLDILRNIDKKIIIVSKNIDEILKKKYESQYKNVKFIKTDAIHDRFIIIDRKTLYHSGESFKDIGKKCGVIMELTDKFYLPKLLEIVDKEIEIQE